MRRSHSSIARGARICTLIAVATLLAEPSPLHAIQTPTVTTTCAVQAKLAPRRFTFPRDDGKHDGYAVELWRTFGRLHDSDGNVFDFGVNISRTEVGRCYAGARRTAGATDHVLSLAYVLLDEQTRHVERGMRVEREAVIGGSIASEHLAIATDRAKFVAQAHGSNETFALSLRDGDPNAISLALSRSATPIALGPGGVTTTGSCDECEAYAYAAPRNPTNGVLRIAGTDHRVSGSTWFEHEFAHHELGPTDIGWTRYEVQFDDGGIADVRLARNDAGRQSATAGVYIDARGRVTYLNRGDAGTSSSVGFDWKSDRTGISYPDLLTFGITPAHLGLTAEEVAQDQEIRATARQPYYWGAIDVQTLAGDDRGHGFVELTGYGSPVSL